MNYFNRTRRLIGALKAKKVDALLVRKKQNIAYLTGTKGEDALLFVSKGGNFLVTDSRYREEYARSPKNYQLIITKDKNIYSLIDEACRKTHSRRIGFESNSISHAGYTALKKKLKNKKLVPISRVVEDLRMIKDSEEVRRIKKACKDGSSIMDYAIKCVKPGLTEKQVKSRIEERVMKKGMKTADFDIIVASGRNASMPHASSSNKKIKGGEMVVIDLGIMNYGYNSDLTRTVFLGRIDRKSLAIYNTVREAQTRAIGKIRPCIRSSYIDNISRQYIKSEGFGKYFIHSLGHGLGMETHERPGISASSKTILQKNMVITIEPGIYIPGWGGVRIEDVVLVTKNGREILTRCRYR
ncbi:MAG: aminopeptidase P family protein [Candidatus Omnitrophica bacterium]|nr:aminopeptidase P family protein [Candidatus Omnitrophota bacterium]MBU4590454.1 aminopeptidase P family protein [Candidatus Omnitrophota bacterium]